jgi:RND family efflux transporter MFP subunit
MSPALSLPAKLLSPIVLAWCLVLSACDTAAPPQQEVVRGLKAYRISDSSVLEVRRYPSVVQPAQESKLSFEVGGALQALDLEIGQKVEQGEVLAKLDPRSVQLQVQQSEAALAQATANLDKARSDYQRRAPLLEKGYVTRSEYDDARSNLDSALAQAEQAKQQLSINQQGLRKSRLVAPFQGTIAKITAKDYQQVAAGQEIVALYTEGAYEINFSVPASVINVIKLGDVARVRFFDLSEDVYEGVITELGSRAEQVSAFPVVVTILDVPAGLHAGMAADVELDVPLQYSAGGVLVPISSFDFSANSAGVSNTRQAVVYVFDETTSTVHAREVFLAGVLGNRVIISEGLSAGEIVASAGVSYLHDGMQVALLPLEQ